MKYLYLVVLTATLIAGAMMLQVVAENISKIGSASNAYAEYLTEIK